MKIRKPDYYDRFQCIAGACSDSCCIGWEIDVDEERREEYRNVTGELGERLRRCIDWDEGHFILQGKEERCPFLNQDNLCDLIIGLGEESLCEICREHPRYYEWYDGLTEVGVGLCCEAAARLVLEREERAAFMVEEEDPHSDGEMTGNLEVGSDVSNAAEADAEIQEQEDALNVLFQARETAFIILQNRKHSIWNRLRQFLAYIEELQEALDFENLDEIEESAEYYKNRIAEDEALADREMSGMSGNDAEMYGHTEAYQTLLTFCRQLEPIDESWPKRLDKLDELLADADWFSQVQQEFLAYAKSRDYEYEHLAVYFVYRYFMKCRMDGDIYSRGCLAVFCVLLIRLLDVAAFADNQTHTKEMRVQNAKDCSKEIEYSEDNLEILSELFWEQGFDHISKCL